MARVVSEGVKRVAYVSGHGGKRSKALSNLELDKECQITCSCWEPNLESVDLQAVVFFTIAACLEDTKKSTLYILNNNHHEHYIRFRCECKVRSNVECCENHRVQVSACVILQVT